MNSNDKKSDGVTNEKAKEQINEYEKNIILLKEKHKKEIESREMEIEVIDITEHKEELKVELEKSNFEETKFAEYTELFRWFAVPGLAILLLVGVLKETRFRSLP